MPYELDSAIRSSGKEVDVVILSTFTQANTREQLESGEPIGILFGKIAAWLSDLEPVAFSGNKSDVGLSNVENKSSATIRGELTQSDIESALNRTITSIEDKTYTYIQEQPATSWTINHNLNKYCNITVYDGQGNECFCDINVVNMNRVVLTFNKALSGRAILN